MDVQTPEKNWSDDPETLISPSLAEVLCAMEQSKNQAAEKEKQAAEGNPHLLPFNNNHSDQLMQN